MGLKLDRRPPLLKYLPFEEAERRVLDALKKLLSMQRGRRATIRARYVLLILWGRKPRRNAELRAHMHDLFFTVALLRETPEVEVDGWVWRLKKVEYKDGWVFTYARVGRRGSRRCAAA